MRFRLGLTVAAFAVVAFNAQAASASCGYSGTQVFQPWGDTSLYTPVPGSSFESGSPGWVFDENSRLITNDSSPLLGIAGSRSLEVGGSRHGELHSPQICVDATTPSMRFFLRRVSGSGSLTVNSVLSGSQIETTVATFAGASAWAPSASVVFPNWGLTGNLTAMFKFETDAGTVYRIDDVYIDPYRCC